MWSFVIYVSIGLTLSFVFKTHDNKVVALNYKRLVAILLFWPIIVIAFIATANRSEMEW